VIIRQFANGENDLAYIANTAYTLTVRTATAVPKPEMSPDQKTT
jgi:hypothetical protein